MKKIKKTLALSLALTMGLSLAACGKDEDEKTTATPATTAPKTEAATTEAPGTDAPATDAPATEAPTTEAPASELDLSNEGKVLNIYAWNEEFKSRLTDHYPGYTEVDATHGKIGDIDVVWTIVPSQEGAYQSNLDQTLLNIEDMPADEQ